MRCPRARAVERRRDQSAQHERRRGRRQPPTQTLVLSGFQRLLHDRLGPKVSKCSEGIVRAVNGLVFYEQGPFQHSRRRHVRTKTRAHLLAHAHARESRKSRAWNSAEPISLTAKEKR